MAVITLKDATHPDLLFYAQNVLNLEVAEHATRAQLVALIRASGHQGSSFEIDDDARRQASGAPRTGAERKKDYTHVNLTIVVQQGVAGGDQPVAVSFNGRAMWIPRGEPAVIPRIFFDNCLANAVEVVYPETPNPKGPDESPLRAPLETPRFQYIINEFITDKEREEREMRARSSEDRKKAAAA